MRLVHRGGCVVALDDQAVEQTYRSVMKTRAEAIKKATGQQQPENVLEHMQRLRDEFERR